MARARKKTTSSRNALLGTILEEMYVLHQRMAVRHGLNEKGGSITHAQWIVLCFIARHTEACIRDISEHLGVSSQAVTQVVNELRRKQLVKSAPHETDGRVIMLALSKKAQKLFSAKKKEALYDMKYLFEPLSDTELQSFARLHTKLIQ